MQLLPYSGGTIIQDPQGLDFLKVSAFKPAAFATVDQQIGLIKQTCCSSIFSGR